MGTVWVVEGSNIQTYDDGTYAAGVSVGGTGSDVLSICLAPDSSKVFVVDTNTGLVSSFVASTLVPIATTTLTVTVGHCSVYADVDGARLYVSSRADNKVFVLNATTLASITSFVVTSPYGITELPDGTALYISQESASSVAVINTVGYGLVTTIPVGANPIEIKMHSSGAFCYVANFTAATISVITTASNTVGSTISPAAATFIFNIKLSPTSDRLYAVGGFTTDAWRITTATNTVANHLVLGADAADVVVTGDGLHAWFGENTQIEAYTSPADILAHTITTTATYMVAIPNPFPPLTPPSITVPNLFIPRKGMTGDGPQGSYTAEDLMIDFLAIQRWANSWAPNLFIPIKEPKTHDEFNADWLTIGVWAQFTANAALVAGGHKAKTLFIPRQDGFSAEDLTIDFLAIQNWANSL